MESVLEMVSKFGVIPILMIGIWFLHRRNETLMKTIKEKNKEIREIEKENIGLLYKCLAALKKINKKDNE